MAQVAAAWDSGLARWLPQVLAVCPQRWPTFLSVRPGSHSLPENSSVMQMPPSGPLRASAAAWRAVTSQAVSPAGPFRS